MRVSRIIVAILLLSGAAYAGIEKHRSCPIDGLVATFTGKTREMDGGCQAQYKHIYIHFLKDGRLTDEPHVFWEETDCSNK